MTRDELCTILASNLPDITNKQLWIWGTGHTTDLYISGLKRLESVEIYGFCDNDSKKWGKEKAGWPIVAPNDLYRRSGEIFVLISSWQKSVYCAVKKQLEEHDIQSMPIDEFIFKTNREKVIVCYDSLTEEKSKEIYAHLINQRMHLDMPSDDYISDNTYFSLRAFKRYGRTVFVDCGAYTGDTIEKFIWNIPSCEKVYAFEPDKGNFMVLKNSCSRLKQEWNISDDKIELYNVAVGAENRICDFSATATISSSVSQDKDGVVTVNMVKLDDVLTCKYTFLKADVESFEYELLQGAEKGIKKWLPSMAICIYHNAIDMITILPLIKEMVPHYKFAIRHHGVTFDETVLYAWVEECENGWIQ